MVPPAETSAGAVDRWENYQRLTLSWRAAKFAQGALREPPMDLRVRAVERAELERFVEDPAYGISPRFLERLESRTDLCVGGFVGGSLRATGSTPLRPRI
jgi:hypothetical protein